MKKYIAFLLCISTVLLCSCSSEYSVDGYENFQVSHSHYELNNCLLPTEDFAEMFQYNNIEYYYREKYKSMLEFVEKSLLVIKYEKSIYELAKEYCLQNMQLADSHYIEYNGYVFIENIKLAIAQDRYGTLNDFPALFNMFSYNDNLNCLVFMGIYCPNYTSDDAQNVRANWGDFLEKHFSDIYEWDG